MGSVSSSLVAAASYWLAYRSSSRCQKFGSPMCACVPAGAVAAGTVVNGRYTVEEVLGRGANAITYRAKDNNTGRQVGCWSSSSWEAAEWQLSRGGVSCCSCWLHSSWQYRLPGWWCQAGTQTIVCSPAKAARGPPQAHVPFMLAVLTVHHPTSCVLCAVCAAPQVALKALSLKGIKDWKQLELFQREAVVLQVRGGGLCLVANTLCSCRG